MRVDLRKVLFIGLESDKERFFERAQERGIVEFLGADDKNIREHPLALEQLQDAIKVVLSLPPSEQEEGSSPAQGLKVACEILELRQTLNELEKKQQDLKQEIERIAPFGHFDLSELAAIAKETKRHLHFFCGKKGLGESLASEEELIFLGSHATLDYFVAIQKEPKVWEGLSEVKVTHALSDLQRDLHKAEGEHHTVFQKLKVYAKYNRLLHEALTLEADRYHLKLSKKTTEQPIENHIFTTYGWVPVNKEEELSQLAEESGIHYENVAIEPKDRIPTQLDNQGAGRIGEDLVHIYDTPSIADKDPSLWVLVFFTLFFSVILTDGGYGLVLLLIVLLAYYKIKSPSKTAKRFLSLAAILATASLVWGMMASSFFGSEFPLAHHMRPIAVIDKLVEAKTAYIYTKKGDAYQKWIKEFPSTAHLTDPEQILEKASVDKNGIMTYPLEAELRDNVLLELSLFIGTLHIVLGMARYVRRNPAALGWMILLIGAYLYLPLYLDATSFVQYLLGFDRKTAGELGFQLMIGGFSLGMIISIIKHPAFGIFEFAIVIQLLADILSYLRIYALALAGEILATTTNEIAASLPIVLAVILLFVGHVVNFSLGLMGGVIHGLRLVFIEWYRYSFEGGGKPFNPLKLISKS